MRRTRLSTSTATAGSRCRTWATTWPPSCATTATTSIKAPRYRLRFTPRTQTSPRTHRGLRRRSCCASLGLLLRSVEELGCLEHWRSAVSSWRRCPGGADDENGLRSPGACGRDEEGSPSRDERAPSRARHRLGDPGARERDRD